jgi:hypothetical protein
MSTSRSAALERLRHLEGQQVTVALRDGRRLDAELVSAGGRDVHTVWLVVDGRDVLLPVGLIAMVAEGLTVRRAG